MFPINIVRQVEDMRRLKIILKPLQVDQCHLRHDPWSQDRFRESKQLNQIDDELRT
jgi:hypothetical protein